MKANQFEHISQKQAEEMDLLTEDEEFELYGTRSCKYIAYTPYIPEGNFENKNRLGWKVKYYSAKKRTPIQRDGVGNEIVYVLQNDLHPGLLKIGYTARNIGDRIREINGATGVVGEYKVIYQCKTHNGQQLERAVHKELDHLRIDAKKEHFSITPDDAKKVILELHERLG
jgi:hypothetical protein